MSIKKHSIIHHKSLGYGIVINIDKNTDTVTTYFGKSDTTTDLDLFFIKAKPDLISEVHNFTLKDIIQNDLLDGFFDSPTKARGTPYIENDSIITCDFIDDYYLKATIKGSSLYTTYISYNDEKLVMECSCPVGHVCKHLYAISKRAKIMLSSVMDNIEENNKDYSFLSSLNKMKKLSGTSYYEAIPNFIEEMCRDENVENIFKILSKEEYFYLNNANALKILINSEKFIDKIDDFIEKLNSSTIAKSLREFIKERQKVKRKLDVENQFATDYDFCLFYYFVNENYDEIKKLIEDSPWRFRLYDTKTFSLLKVFLTKIDIDESFSCLLEDIACNALDHNSIIECIKNPDVKHKYLLRNYKYFSAKELDINSLSIDDLTIVSKKMGDKRKLLNILKKNINDYLSEHREIDVAKLLFDIDSYTIAQNISVCLFIVNKLPNNKLLLEMIQNIVHNSRRYLRW